jgi:hypothetical protein
MAADPHTGEAQMVEGSQQPAPDRVGYYGQGEWEAVSSGWKSRWPAKCVM